MEAFLRRLKSNLTQDEKLRYRKISKKFMSVVPVFNSLQILSVVYGSDKFGHGYHKPYRHFFGSIRWRKLKLLEIGVGGYRDPNNGGASLRMWKKYFPRSQIFGIDIYNKQSLEEARIRIFQGSQNDPVFLKDVADQICQDSFNLWSGSSPNCRFVLIELDIPPPM